MAGRPKGQSVSRQRVEWLSWALRAAFERGKGLEAVSLLDALWDLTPEQAAWSPGRGIRSIWEIVNHVAAWKAVVLRFQRGEEVSPEALANQWLPMGDLTEANWVEARANLEDRQLEIELGLGKLTDADLDQAIGTDDWNLGKAYLGLVAHDCYHAGQITMLRQLQGL